jgi:hypothetical protein
MQNPFRINDSTPPLRQSRLEPAVQGFDEGRNRQDHQNDGQHDEDYFLGVSSGLGTFEVYQLPTAATRPRKVERSRS